MTAEQIEAIRLAMIDNATKAINLGVDFFKEMLKVVNND